MNEIQKITSGFTFNKKVNSNENSVKTRSERRALRFAERRTERMMESSLDYRDSFGLLEATYNYKFFGEFNSEKNSKFVSFNTKDWRETFTCVKNNVLITLCRGKEKAMDTLCVVFKDKNSTTHELCFSLDSNTPDNSAKLLHCYDELTSMKMCKDALEYFIKSAFQGMPLKDLTGKWSSISEESDIIEGSLTSNKVAELYIKEFLQTSGSYSEMESDDMNDTYLESKAPETNKSESISEMFKNVKFAKKTDKSESIQLPTNYYTREEDMEDMEDMEDEDEMDASPVMANRKMMRRPANASMKKRRMMSGKRKHSNMYSSRVPLRSSRLDSSSRNCVSGINNSRVQSSLSRNIVPKRSYELDSSRRLKARNENSPRRTQEWRKRNNSLHTYERGSNLDIGRLKDTLDSIHRFVTYNIHDATILEVYFKKDLIGEYNLNSYNSNSDLINDIERDIYTD